ncbi:hypothetical protein A7U60_g7885 [Sanghuangporus baumii]|uniref:Uncharacterized protein n=1 Tax=Sanghuangporus baumii TaxID=108892 RepID=A0A9Q5HSN2_SANBA|nr:hypothetical protein A7U60_g7885 [Sanghuangporus baumii]
MLTLNSRAAVQPALNQATSVNSKGGSVFRSFCSSPSSSSIYSRIQTYTRISQWRRRRQAFNVGQSRLYSLSYFGALVSYAIVCYKSFANQNVQYFLLALFWWMSKPIPVSLIPFATFSLFHVLTFVRSNILPHFFPPTPAATAGQPPTQHPFLKKLQGWIKANYDPAMRIVAYTELLILVRVIFGALLFQNSLLAPIIYAHFLRLRYYQSQFTQRAVEHVKTFIDGYVRRPGNPPVLVSVWDKAQFIIARWSGSVLTQQQPANPAGAGPARR